MNPPDAPGDGEETGGELIDFPGKHRTDVDPLAYLDDNRAFLVRRSLLSTAVGGLVPLPVMDDYLAGRVRAGMLLTIADRRRVDLEPSAAALLADSPEGSAVRHATLTALTLVAFKLAWRKFFTLLAVGRRSEDMATTFQLGTLFDHYCARLHVGAGFDAGRATRVRLAAHAAIAETERAALVTAFRDGGRILGRSLLEAPGWVGDRLQRAAETWARAGAPSRAPGEAEAEAESGRWLDRAAAAVEGRLAGMGTAYLGQLIARFEEALQAAESTP